MTSTDFSKLKIWMYLEDVLVNDTSDSADTQILDAKMKKIENWKVHKTFQEVANEGQSTISAGWVVTKRNKTKENIYKARLVSRSFEQIEKDNIRKDSPTCCKENFRVILSIIVSFEWKIHSFGIKSAFLQGQLISRNVFLKPPPEVDIYC